MILSIGPTSCNNICDPIRLEGRALDLFQSTDQVTLSLAIFFRCFFLGPDGRSKLVGGFPHSINRARSNADGLSQLQGAAAERISRRLSLLVAALLLRQSTFNDLCHALESVGCCLDLYATALGHCNARPVLGSRLDSFARIPYPVLVPRFIAIYTRFLMSVLASITPLVLSIILDLVLLFFVKS